MSGALYQGTADDWDHAWSIGRSVFGGGGDGTPADWFGGIIDEVRLSNRVLALRVSVCAGSRAKLRRGYWHVRSSAWQSAVGDVANGVDTLNCRGRRMGTCVGQHAGSSL